MQYPTITIRKSAHRRWAVTQNISKNLTVAMSLPSKVACVRLVGTVAVARALEVRS